jgi:hypothetical protein
MHEQLIIRTYLLNIRAMLNPRYIRNNHRYHRSCNSRAML